MSARIYKILFCTGFIFLLPVFIFAQTGLVNINTAGSEELQTLNGIGPTYAQRIIDYRSSNGPFQTIEEIKNVNGIGETTFSKIKDYITVGETSTTLTSSNVSNTNTSGQSVSSPVSSKVAEISLAIETEKMGSVGAPVMFKVVTNASYGRNNIFLWNFGDGSQAGGDRVNHTYAYPGEYIVVLRGSLTDKEIITRVKVKIINPELMVIAADNNKITLGNEATSDINLFGRALVVGERFFLFPEETWIGAGQSLTLNSQITGLRPANASDVTLMIVGENPLVANVVQLIDQEKEKKIAAIESEISTLQGKLSRVSAPKVVAVAPAQSESTEVSEQPATGLVSQTASVASAQLPEKSSWWDWVKRFFLRNHE